MEEVTRAKTDLAVSLATKTNENLKLAEELASVKKSKFRSEDETGHEISNLRKLLAERELQFQADNDKYVQRIIKLTDEEAKQRIEKERVEEHASTLGVENAKLRAQFQEVVSKLAGCEETIALVTRRNEELKESLNRPVQENGSPDPAVLENYERRILELEYSLKCEREEARAQTGKFQKTIGELEETLKAEIVSIQALTQKYE